MNFYNHLKKILNLIILILGIYILLNPFGERGLNTYPIIIAMFLAGSLGYYISLEDQNIKSLVFYTSMFFVSIILLAGQFYELLDITRLYYFCLGFLPGFVLVLTGINFIKKIFVLISGLIYWGVFLIFKNIIPDEIFLSITLKILSYAEYIFPIGLIILAIMNINKNYIRNYR